MILNFGKKCLTFTKKVRDSFNDVFKEEDVP